MRCYTKPESIHATCDDYRAGATIDLEHDEADSQTKISCPLLVLWGANGFVSRTYKVLDVWQQYAEQLTGAALACGHFLPEEAPEAVCDELLQFFGRH